MYSVTFNILKCDVLCIPLILEIGIRKCTLSRLQLLHKTCWVDFTLGCKLSYLRYREVQSVTSDIRKCTLVPPISGSVFCYLRYQKVYSASSNIRKCTLLPPISGSVLCYLRYREVYSVTSDIRKCTLLPPISCNVLCYLRYREV